jgi:hypothetical protein
MIMNSIDREHLEEVIALYVNNQASASDKAWIESLMHEPEVVSMLNWHQNLKRVIREERESVDDSVGLAGLMAKIRQSEEVKPATEPVSPSKKIAEGWWKPWLSLDRWMPSSLQAPAFAALLLVVGAQGVLLYQHGDELGAGEGGYSTLRGASDGPASAKHKVTMLKVNFKDETPERELRLLLISVGAEIVRGPRQLGDYDVSVPTHRVEAALAALQKSPWVNAARLAQPSAQL